MRMLACIMDELFESNALRLRIGKCHFLSKFTAVFLFCRKTQLRKMHRLWKRFWESALSKEKLSHRWVAYMVISI